MPGDLKVRCKACGKAFRSPVQLDRARFADPSNELPPTGYQCSKCGQKRVYDKVDHYFE